jgi:four helix bundle protein
MTYEQWAADVPECIRKDILWKMEAYRLALFAYDLIYEDCAALRKDDRTRALISQVVRAAGSISANVEEGYSRNTGRERGRFYEFAEGSAREVRGWYYKCRKQFSDKAVEHRLELATSLIRLLTRMTSNERKTPDLQCIARSSSGTKNQEPSTITEINHVQNEH